MKMRLVSLWDNWLGSFWFFPAMLIILAAVLGVVFPFLDETAASGVGKSFWQTNTMDGARTVLSSIAGSMITVAGVVFSMTMVTLSIAASQFGSRVLRTRMKDRTTQVAMSTFLGTSVYCFLVLRTVHEANGVEFVPQLSLLLGVALAVASMFVLIYFIHDVAASIQASHIVASLAADMDDSIDRIFPDEMGWGDEEGKVRRG